MIREAPQLRYELSTKKSCVGKSTIVYLRNKYDCEHHEIRIIMSY